MTANGFIQIALYCVVVTLLVKPLGLFMARALNGQRNFLTPVIGPVEHGFYAAAGVHRVRTGMAGLYILGARLFNGGVRSALRDPAAAVLSSAQSAGFCWNGAASRVQHCRQLRHQHQLAILRRRNDAQQFQPDGWPDRAELSLCRSRHQYGHCPDPRLCSIWRSIGRQLLGGPDARHSLRPSADLDRCRALFRLGRACRKI